MAQVLVTGATGFIGSHLVRALLARADDVRVTVRPSSPLDALDGLEVERVSATSGTARRCAAPCAARRGSSTWPAPPTCGWTPTGSCASTPGAAAAVRPARRRGRAVHPRTRNYTWQRLFGELQRLSGIEGPAVRLRFTAALALAGDLEATVRCHEERLGDRLRRSGRRQPLGRRLVGRAMREVVR